MRPERKREIEREIERQVERQRNREGHNLEKVQLALVFLALEVRWTRDRKVAGSNPGKERRENFLLQSQLCVLTLYSVSVPPPCYCSST